MPKPLFVEVAVPLPIDHTFTYRVPTGLEERALVGVRVLVPFGKRKLTGLVTALSDGSALEGRQAKELLSFLDEAPYISSRHVEFLLAAAREALAPAGEMLRAALPRALPRQAAPVAARTENFYRLPPGFSTEGLTRKQRQVAEALGKAGEMSASELSEALPNGATAARNMASQGVLLVETRLKPVVTSAPCLPDAAGKIVPTRDQEEALAQLNAAVATGDHATFLLHGVTGSGKTEVYLRAAELVRAAGRQTIFLVPEIALTPQLLGRVRSRFGEGIAVLHSGLTPAERAAQWRKVRAGETAICVGARSAVFSPFPNLGLIVIDEEQDSAYKQEDGVRYQARNLALLRGSMERAVVLMGSATPSAEAWQMTKTGGATLLSMPNRIGSARLPDI
ncbi:MAG: DEAD/DEAH box helicase, partial [Syntrophorhabdaceae bacterium]|nr:DEAD/DEAH box helicase [Syntrophorhabdaceae bacterium]